MTEFKETQRLRIIRLWVVIILITSTFAYGYLKQAVYHKPFWGGILPDPILAMLLIIFSGGLLLMVLIRMDTKINEKGIYYKFMPLQWRYTHIPWDDIEDAYVRNYEPFYEFFGWGLKGDKDNRVCSMSGKIGLQIIFRNGDKILIGTLKKDEIDAVVKRHFRPWW